MQSTWLRTLGSALALALRAETVGGRSVIGGTVAGTDVAGQPVHTTEVATNGLAVTMNIGVGIAFRPRLN